MRLAAKRLKREPDEKDIERTLRYLAARGISYDAAKRAVRALINDPDLFDEAF